MAQVDSIEWDGNLHVAVPPSGSSKTVNGITRESAQVMGFKNGDQVTVIGLKGSDGSLIPKRIFGGDRATLLRELIRNAWLAYSLGIAFVLAAFLIVFQRIKVQAEDRDHAPTPRNVPSKSS